MVSEGYDSLDGPWNLSNAVQVSELKNLIWTRVLEDIVDGSGLQEGDERTIERNAVIKLQRWSPGALNGKAYSCWA